LHHEHHAKDHPLNKVQDFADKIRGFPQIMSATWCLKGKKFSKSTTNSRKSRKFTPWKEYMLYYWSQSALEIGVTKQEIDGYNVRIYELEESVCDA
jgi:hypothetical protein